MIIPDRKLPAHIGSKIVEYRKQANITQEELAEFLGCSQGQVSKYERGERDVSAFELARLARRLQVPIEEFYPDDLRQELDSTEVQLLNAWRDHNIVRLLELVVKHLK